MRTTPRWILFSLLVSLIEMSAWGAVQAVRSLPDEYFLPGVQITVTIKVTGDPGAVTVTEQPPADWAITRVMGGGVAADGKITWDLASFTGNKTLTYYLTPPAGAAQDGIFSGKAGEAVITGPDRLSVPKPAPGKQVPLKTGLTYPYWLYLPENYGAGDQKWPMILFLHGAGERGDTLTGVKTHGPPKLLGVAANREKFPELFQCVVVSPQCPVNKWWLNPPLYEVFNQVVTTYAVDPRRIYITGLSMGGFGSWSFAGAYPDWIAAAVPICGAGDAMKWKSITSYTRDTIPAANLANLVTVPIWAFHGAKDGTVPESLDAQTVAELRALGGNVEYTVYPNADHDSWTATYNNPEVYQWLLKQSQPAPSAVKSGTDM